MPFVSLKNAYNQLDIQHKAAIIKPKDTGIASIAFSTKIFASYDKEMGWSFKTLGFWDRILRQLGIKHKDTILSKDSYLDDEHHTLSQQETTSQKSGDLFKVVIQKIATAQPEEIKRLDTDFVDLEMKARLYKKDFLEFRRGLIINGEFDKEHEKKYKDFELRLKNKFLPMMQTASSLEIAIWQDQEFLDALTDPVMVKLFLKHFYSNDELEGGFFTLSDKIFDGLANNQFSHLMTAVPFAGQQRKLTQVDLTKAMLVLENFRNELITLYKEDQKDEFEVKNLIRTSSPRALIKAFNTLIDAQKMNLFISNRNKALLECYEGMSQFNERDPSAMLAKGSISASLDAEHLAAGLFGLKEGLQPDDPNKQKGMQNFKSLIEKLQNNQLDPESEYLMTVRLQQLFTIFANSPNDIGLSHEDLKGALKQ